VQTSSGARLDLPRLATLVAALALGIFFWDSPLLWPLKLLVVMMHESGHALATLFVGGKVDHIRIAADQSGQCLSYLPPGVLRKVAVYSAGYLGSTVAGAAMILATFRFRLHRAVPAAAAVWLAVMGVLYVRDLFTAAFCAATIAVLALSARYLPDGPLDVMNLFLAAFTALYAVFDLRDDLWNPAIRAQSDAALLAEHTWLPPVAWALVWTAFSVALLALALWLSLRGGRARAARAGVDAPGLEALQRRGRIR
jgi:hypothetical protein